MLFWEIIDSRCMTFLLKRNYSLKYNLKPAVVIVHFVQRNHKMMYKKLQRICENPCE